MKKQQETTDKTDKNESSVKKINNNNQNLNKPLNSFLTSQSGMQRDKNLLNKSKENDTSKFNNRSKSKPASSEIQRKTSQRVIKTISPQHVDFLNIDSKHFHQIINKHFKYLKQILPLSMYSDIKEKFYLTLQGLLGPSVKLVNNNNSLSNNTNSSTLINESQSSIFAYVTKSKEEELKMSINSSSKIDNNISVKDKPANTNGNLNLITSTSKRNNQVKHSLYNLIKGRSHVTPSNSKSKSESRDCSSNTRKALSNPKPKEIVNINLTKKTVKPAIGNSYNNHQLLNGKLLTKIGLSDQKKDGSLERSSRKPEIINLTIEPTKIDNLSNVKSGINHKNYKGSFATTTTGKSDKNQKTNDNGKIKDIKPQMIYLKMNTLNQDDKTNHVQPGKTNERSNKKDLMKEVKKSLDDNLKVMFNFSYENFLSKESESQSKQSHEPNEENMSLDNN